MNDTDPLCPPDAFPAVDLDTWRARVERELNGKPFDKALVRQVPGGPPVPPLFVDQPTPPRGAPGAAPYVRGATPPDVHPPGWIASTRHHHPEPRVLNQWVLEDLHHGVSGVYLALDRAGRQGLAPEAAPDAIGDDGAAIYNLADLDAALTGVVPAAIDLSFEVGPNAHAGASLLAAWLDEQGLDPGLDNVHLYADPLGAWARDGRLHRDLPGALQELAQTTQRFRARTTHGRTALASGLVYHSAGADVGQELGLTLATAVAYLRALEAGGVDLPEAAAAITLQVAVGRDVFVEVAKLRALRLLWSKVLGASGLTALPRPRVHAVTSPRTLTVADPWVNMLRGTTQVFAAIVGGADVITPLPFDRAVGRPDALGRRVARNTATVLREESHLGFVLDPGGGSHYLESLTDDLARAGWTVFQEVERQGGLAEALQAGWVAEQLAAAWAERRRALALRKEPVTGVSEFPDPDEAPVERAPEVSRDERVASLERVATHRQARGAFNGDGPTAKAGATLDELTIRSGDPATQEPLGAVREAEAFEALRARGAAVGDAAEVVLYTLGPESEWSGRATFARNLFGVAGLRCREGDAGEVVCICGIDGRYPEDVPRVAELLKEAGTRQVWVAGRGGEHEAGWRAAGVDGFVHLGCDVEEVLDGVLRVLEGTS